MTFKSKISIVIGVIFLCHIGLIQASQGNFTCQTRYKADTNIFSHFRSDSSQSFKINVPDLDWFTSYNQSIVNIVNTRNKEIYTYNITKLSPFNLNPNRKYKVYQTLYIPQKDILLVGGFGLLAIIDATKNYQSGSIKSSKILDPDPGLWILSLLKFTNDSFVSLCVDYYTQGSQGTLTTYNITTFKIISEQVIFNFPSQLLVLNQTHMMTLLNYGQNAQVVTLPYLNISNTISFDRDYQTSTEGMIANNASSYFTKNVAGLCLFKNITNGLPSVNFGREFELYDRQIGSLNQKDAFMTFNLYKNYTIYSITIDVFNFKQVLGGYEIKNFTGYYFTQKKFQSNEPNQFGFSEPFISVDSNQSQLQVVLGSNFYYWILDCYYYDY